MALLNPLIFLLLNIQHVDLDALRVILEQFEGPLDLLLYLIKKQNIDIIDIPILPITTQYVNYINMMQQMQFELA